MRRPERKDAMKEFIVWFIRSWFWAMKRSNQLINSLKQLSYGNAGIAQLVRAADL